MSYPFRYTIGLTTERAGPEDVLSDLIYDLEHETKKFWQARRITKAVRDACLALAKRANEAAEPEFEAYIEKICDAMQAFAAPFFYFGESKEGYGFWLQPDALEEAVYDGSVVKIEAGDPWPKLDKDVEYVLEVTDHGNMSLYDRRHKEIWAVV